MTFNLVATHPDSPSKGTERAQKLVVLYPHRGRLYAGYGDMDSDQGPINIRAYDPASSTFGPNLLTLATEELNRFQSIDGVLYAMCEDPTSGNGPSYGKENTDQTFTGGLGPTPVVHAFDIAKYGSDLFVAGSYPSSPNDAGIVWRSTNNGASWSESLRVEARSGADYCRCTWLAVLDGKLYTQPWHGDGTSHGASKVWDGASWANGPDFYYTYNAAGMRASVATIDGTEYILQTTFYPDYAVYLAYFDVVYEGYVDYGRTLYDYVVDPVGTPTLYAIQSDRTIVKTTNLLSYSNFIASANVPATAQSIAILDGWLYVGAGDGTLYKWDVPLHSSSATVTAPAAQLTLTAIPPVINPSAEATIAAPAAQLTVSAIVPTVTRNISGVWSDTGTFTVSGGGIVVPVFWHHLQTQGIA